ncbi:hypothetical protein M407DRAFT_247011 [Tulasnella calospora MUT 4182]|uniref:Uncharacterized protein n=1 Tax=Tulasnella calospora MUT 4182 TaxID=1051891 RepID=A0A0C3Q211_9AGAM|nr:hypothetical protein M407DRAFT_247011 [Tulasnella calospora MUT 4182]
MSLSGSHVNLYIRRYGKTHSASHPLQPALGRSPLGYGTEVGALAAFNHHGSLGAGKEGARMSLGAGESWSTEDSCENGGPRISRRQRPNLVGDSGWRARAAPEP